MPSKARQNRLHRAPLAEKKGRRRSPLNQEVGGADFVPPHCPRRHCAFYQPKPRWHWKRNGFYVRKSDGATFQQFKCLHCRSGFSTRAFEADYWLKRRDLLPLLARQGVEGPGNRQLARMHGVHHSTVALHLARLGRLGLLFHQERLREVAITEPVVLDGFETFELSQYFPYHLNVLAGSESWFLYHFTDSPLRRKGHMTAEQKRRRAQLEKIHGRPDRKAIIKGVKEILTWCSGRLPAETALVLRSDEHPAYVRAIQEVRARSGCPSIAHEVTSAKAARTPGNPLFPVNLIDLLLRHGLAAHRRESIAFNKRRQGGIDRAGTFIVWRNWVKKRSEKKDETTAAMAAGYAERPVTWDEVLERRRFPREELLPGSWSSYYWRKVRTVALPRQREHKLKYAF